nr:PREDICTED: unconventional myosin-Va isoform X1 [Bemisia tabaci]
MMRITKTPLVPLKPTLKKIPDEDPLRLYIDRFQKWADATEYQLFYRNGTRVWVPHPDFVWESALVVADYKEKVLEVSLENSKELKNIPISSDADLPPLCNPDILIGQNDLTSLSYLHEPAVLYNLQVRFVDKCAIYTYCGIVLVAINPYSELPIYGSDTIWAYRGQAMGDLEPHIFAVAEEAYTKMEREKQDQSIIVSGESGAGKTVSAKYAMRYFATVGGSTTETQIEKKVLASSPIMEAIGNAKTIRNDNSSRFGKFIELQFSKNYNINGASMRTYLLEKSRVVFQAAEERNYHIFYQLCASRSRYPHLKLDQAKQFMYLNQEDSIAGIDDEVCFNDTLSAFTTLGFSEADINDMLKILASILHLGNISILQGSHVGDRGDADSSYISEKDFHLKTLTELLDLDIQELMKWLCHRRIISMRETFDKDMNMNEAMGARDALAKHIYAQLFAWIVSQINRSLESSDAKYKFIGVLDIYGFETFETNSFEQFCINYANEKLQQQFNQHVFKLEQEEYLKEEIEWKFIDFYDNQPCIDLIEIKLGILDLLDEECRMPKGTDASWADKLYNKCEKWQHFSKPRFGTKTFSIKHFADLVEYDTAGFLEKNKDTVIEEQVNVLRSSRNQLLRHLFVESEKKLAPQYAATIGHSGRTKVAVLPQKSPSATLGSSAKQHKKTVGSQFRDSLNALMVTLNATTPHYIRCIKPNDFKQPFEYNPVRAVQQLRACGVLETIRISAAGFPSRWTYFDFMKRYRVLCSAKDIDRNDMKKTCERTLQKCIKNQEKYKFGKSKIFFRAGQVAYLEKLRADKLKHCCIIIQKTVRGYLAKRRYQRIKSSTLTIQRVVRGFLARRRVHRIRQLKSAIIIQKRVRGWLQRTKYLRLRRTAFGLQRYGRGLLARRKFLELKYNKAALVIQKRVRGWLAKKKYKEDLQKIVICQSAIRRFLARRRYKKLKREARSVEHIKKLNKGLENKIISMQQRIGELTKENTSLKTASQEKNEMLVKLDSLKGADSELKKLKNVLNEKEIELSAIRAELSREKSEKMDLLNDYERDKTKLLNDTNKLRSENEQLKEKLSIVMDEMTESKVNLEEIIRTRIEHERQILIREQDQDREAYQKLLSEKNMLESRLEALEKEGNKTGNLDSFSSHNRSLSDASTVSVCDPESSASNMSDHSEEKTDLQLVLKLQQKVKSLEAERAKLHKRIEESENLSSPESRASYKDAIKAADLEIENEKLKADLTQLRQCIAENCDSANIGEIAVQELLSQFSSLQSELTRKRDECLQLRGVLLNNTESIKSVATSNYSTKRDVDIINEDGELAIAFEAQKKINRQLEREIESEKAKWSQKYEDLVQETKKLREENERQQKLLSVNLNKTPQSQTESIMQHEITRLTSENLDLQEKVDHLQEEIRRLKRQLSRVGNPPEDEPAVNGNNVKVENGEHGNNLPLIRKKERNYLGMIEYQKGDEDVIMRHLIIELKPKVAVTLLPGLPAYILFMCIRHTDYINDDEKVRALLTAFINQVKKVIKRQANKQRQQDNHSNHSFEVTILWLSNTLRLLNNLKQYSGDKAFQEHNTKTQNAQCLLNFDLSEYRQVLSDIAVWIYQSVINYMEEKIQQLAITAVLEYESIMSQPTRSKSTSSADSSPTLSPPSALQEQLSTYHAILCAHGVDSFVINQAFKQLFYFICASCMNTLLLRKDLCNWAKGMQIRFNISHLEQWCRDQKLLDSSEILDTLLPIVQAAQLLQARKTKDDVESICEMCSKMTPNQIIKLLNLYTPADEFEGKISVQFIRSVQEILSQRPKDAGQPLLLMDTKHNFPVRFPFSPSTIRLEHIEIPECLNLSMLKKV